jgi:HAD superfamily hydrolase (TIGR01509 family)
VDLMIKNIIFDIGNTLIYFKPLEYLSKEFVDKDIVSALYETIFKSSEWLSLDRGTITQEEAVRRFCQRQPSLKKQIEYVMDNWDQMHIPMEDSIKLLNYLKNNGYFIYLLSNYHEKAFDYIYNKFSFIKEVHGMVISSHVKLLKPEKAIYETLLKKYSLEPGECLFIDDYEDNIEAAKKLGMHGICFKDTDSVYEYVESLNNQRVS